MTDNERNRIDAICKIANVGNIGDLSDGFHTFNQLYYQRMMLFLTIVKQNRDRAWKSLKHEDGELCFGGGWFIIGITTPEGEYTYHYEEKYYSLFDCQELERGKHWDGHTEKDVTRLLSLPSTEPEKTCEYWDSESGFCAIHRPSAQSERKTGRWIKGIGENGVTSSARCSQCWFEDNRYELFNFCPNCGADMMEVEHETD